MLVLSRKKNENIVIGENITVTVLGIRGDKVRLGIIAPKAVAIHRQEIHDQIKDQQATRPVRDADQPPS
jgi:carbon storage regulator